MHGVKEVFGAASSTALLYACATPPTLATFVPSPHLSCSPAQVPLLRRQGLGLSKRISHLWTPAAGKSPLLAVNSVPPSADGAFRVFHIGSPYRFGTELRSFPRNINSHCPRHARCLGCRALVFSQSGDRPVEAELMQAILRFPDQFGLEDNRVGTIRLAWLQQPNQKDGCVVQHPFKRHLFAGILVPLQLALLHKEIFSAVPSRYFHLIEPCDRKIGLVQHPRPPHYANAGQEPIAAPRILMKMQMLPG